MSIILTPSMSGDEAFDETAWRICCKRMAAQAKIGDGLVYELFVSHFSSQVEAAVARMSPAHRFQAQRIARNWGYATSDELQQRWAACAGDGYCQHGIQFGYCPVGCDSDY